MTEQEDPFADLEKTISDATDNESQDEKQPATTTATTPEADTDTMSTQESQPNTDPIEEQAFSFDETKQSAFYAREKTWETFDTTITEIELAAKKRGAKDVSKSEIHDAILSTVDPEAIAEAVIEERRGD